MSNVRYTLFKRLFISEDEVAQIRSHAVDIINEDPLACVPNAYIEATLNFLYHRDHLTNLDKLDADGALRKAELASHFRTSGRYKRGP